MEHQWFFYETHYDAHDREAKSKCAALESKFPGPWYFAVGSSEQIAFDDAISAMGILGARKLIRQVTQRDVGNYPFYYLDVMTLDRNSGERFIDYSHACNGTNGKIRRCWMCAVQSHKVKFDSEWSKADIVALAWKCPAKIIVVSRALKRALESTGVTGCQYVPCVPLSQSASLGEDALRFDSITPELEKSATHYQLVVSSRTKDPPILGKIRPTSVCPRCGALYMYQWSHTAVFKTSRILTNDFQTYDRIRDDDGQEYVLPSEVVLISRKVAELLLLQKFKGLKSKSKYAGLLRPLEMDK